MPIPPGHGGGGRNTSQQNTPSSRQNYARGVGRNIPVAVLTLRVVVVAVEAAAARDSRTDGRVGPAHSAAHPRTKTQFSNWAAGKPSLETCLWDWIHILINKMSSPPKQDGEKSTCGADADKQFIVR